MKDSNNNFRELYKNFPSFEWCKLMKSASKFSSNIIAKCAVTLMKRIAPELTRPCPIPPMKIQKLNISIPNVIIAMIPMADYRVTCIMKAKNGDIFFNSSATFRVY